jgi:hypothetical protein
MNDPDPNLWPEPLLRMRPGQDSPADLFDFKGAMRATTLPERSLRRVIAEGKIEILRASARVIRFRRDAIEEYLEACRERVAA